MQDKPGVMRLRSETVTNTYSVLMHAAQQQVAGLSTETRGGQSRALAAMIMSAFAVEAFLNHLGALKVRTWDSVERRLGPGEKLALLEAELHLKIDRAVSPFNNFAALFAFRNYVAHGRTERSERVQAVSRKKAEQEWFAESTIDRMCTPRRAQRFVADARGIIEALDAHTGGSGGVSLWVLGAFHSETC